MAYWDIARLSGDQDFAQRCMAAYATETVNDAAAQSPSDWWPLHSWRMAATPGFGDQYASAVAGGIEDPGRDPAVITDAQILSAIQSLLAQ